MICDMQYIDIMGINQAISVYLKIASYTYSHIFTIGKSQCYNICPVIYYDFIIFNQITTIYILYDFTKINI